MWKDKPREEFWKYRWEGPHAEKMDKGWDRGPVKLPNEKLIAEHVDAYGVMLDAGAGPCRFAKYFVDRVESYTCVDFSVAMCELARKKTQQFPNVQVYQQDVEKMLFPNNHFDVALMVAVLRHLPRAKIPRVCKELLRVTKNHIWIQLLMGNSRSVRDNDWGNKYLVNHLFFPEEIAAWFKCEPAAVFPLKTHPMDAKHGRNELYHFDLVRL